LPERRTRVRIIRIYQVLQRSCAILSLDPGLLNRWTAARTDAGAPITRLFESMRPDLLRFAHWLARDRTIAEDIVQEALLRAWRSRDALKD